MRLGFIGFVACWLLVHPQSGFGHEHSEHRPKSHGFVGYGIEMWQPSCAFACRQVLQLNRLDCSTTSTRRDMGPPAPGIVVRHGEHEKFETAPECFASNEAYLLSLALCLKTRCNETEAWRLERFWSLHSVGDGDLVTPSLSYAMALERLHSEPPEDTLPVAAMSGDLNSLSTVSFGDWKQTFLADSDTSATEKLHARSGFLVVIYILVLPLIVHFLRLIPLPSRLQRGIRSRIGYSALFGQRHSVPLPGNIGILPTRGQTAFIVFLILVNTILLFTGYQYTEGVGEERASVMMKYIANRAGVLSFANLSLMMLCCGRNNIVVRFTKWSYSTMLLYHRWIAYICILQAALHSGIWLYRHIGMLLIKFSQPYWIWGTIGMCLMVLIVPLSCLPVRRKMYELFVDSHVLLSAATLLGLYYHIYEAFGHNWGWENWIYLASLLWVADRVLRFVKLLRHGMPTADITYLDDEYARIDVPAIKASGHVYLYFPTLDWRFWQNHPFSIATSVNEGLGSGGKSAAFMPVLGEEADDEMGTELHAMLSDDDDTLNNENRLRAKEHDHLNESAEVDARRRLVSGRISNLAEEDAQANSGEAEAEKRFATGLVIYVRRQDGITARLFEKQLTSLPVLVEGPYRSLPIPNIATAATLICIAGGVGISAVLPTLRSHASIGRTSLYWSSRSQYLVDDITLPAGVPARIKVHERWDVQEIVFDEAFRAAPAGGEMIVMVSGPNQMADAVRAAVVRANAAVTASKGSAKLVVRLAEECFSW